MGVATADELLRLGGDALAAADWERARALCEQAAKLGETAEISMALARRCNSGVSMRALSS
jgi:hypothetical protein